MDREATLRMRRLLRLRKLHACAEPRYSGLHENDPEWLALTIEERRSKYALGCARCRCPFVFISSDPADADCPVHGPRGAF